MIEISELKIRTGRKIITIPPLNIGEKGVFLIEGDNGAGKTTLIRLITGIISMNSVSGEINLDGTPVRSLKRHEIARQISYLPQNFHLEIDLPIRDFINQGLYAFHLTHQDAEKRISEIVDILEIKDFLTRSFRELSGGEKQLTRIARSLVAPARYSFLDEPDSFLSRKNKQKMLRLIDQLKENRSLIIVTHDRNLYPGSYEELCYLE